MKNLSAHLKSGTTILADGAIGSMLLQTESLEFVCPEELVLTHPDILEDISNEYLKAGAEIVQTNTFGASPIMLSKYGLEDKSEEINKSAVEIVRSAVKDRAWITGSMGPCGENLQPFGTLETQQFVDSCKCQVNALAAAGVDAVSIETIIDIDEAALAVRTVKSEVPELVILATATFNDTPNGFFTPYGNSIPVVVSRLTQEGADVIGANCSVGIKAMINIATEFVKLAKTPVLFRPNAGLPEIVDGIPVYNETPEHFVQGVKELLELGVTIIGGCCGTTPEYIRSAREMISSEYQNK